MKKLIIALAAIALAIGARAATVNWIMAGVYKPETTTAASGYVAYLFADSVSASLSETYSTVAQSAVVTAITTGKFGDVVGKAIATGTTGTAGNIAVSGIAPTGGFGAGDSISVYAVIFDAATYGAAENYATTAADKTASYTSSTGSKSVSWSNFSSTTGQGWTAVPEPTSGLLMLLGMAGLALRRKRA